MPIYRVTVSAAIHARETRELFRAAEFGVEDVEDFLLVVGKAPVFLDRLPFRIASSPHRFVVSRVADAKAAKEVVSPPEWVPCTPEPAEDEAPPKRKRKTKTS